MERGELSRERAILSRTRARIRQNGWRPDAVQSEDPARCLFWTISDAARELGYDRVPVVQRLQRMVPQGQIALWNDTPGRTPSEVDALLRRAITEIDEEATRADA